MLNNPQLAETTPTSTSNEDLKAFERRLTEIITYYQPQTKRWRILLLIITITTSVTAFQWLSDPRTQQISFFESLGNHIFFTLNCIILIVSFIFGIHKKVVAPGIIISRINSILENFNITCDHNGRLILKRSSPNPLIALKKNSKDSSSRLDYE